MRGVLVARRVNTNIPNFANLGLPPSIEKLCNFAEGLVILAGVTGSGKSTTIASMLDYINEREALHILTLEDPIEYVFSDKMSVINQREIFLDVSDWHIALKHAVREDPDVILVGEMRDQDTFEAGVHAAETGHVVFGNNHRRTRCGSSGRYHGQPMAAHLSLPIDTPHFDRWLALFADTANAICPPAAAAHFIERAYRIADSLELGIAAGKGEIRPRRARPPGAAPAPPG